MTGWTVEGVLQCPACTLYIDFEGSPAQLREAIADHDCAKTAAQARYED